MTVTAEEVRWGGYKGYEGPYHYGLGKLDLKVFPTDGHKLLDIVTQTEGGSPSAVNAYDRCIVSLGLLQWCEAKYFLSSKLLGALADADASLLKPLDAVLGRAEARFAQKSPGRWRFFIGPDEVDTAEEQQRLFLGGATGLRGQWESAQQQVAREWVAAFVNVLHQPAAIEAQVSYTATRMYQFATSKARALLFEPRRPLEGWAGAVQAGFLSFAANLPAVASKHLLIAAGETSAPRFSEDWCIAVLKELTFGPKIAIYPHRYDKIRPKLEQHFGVDLPDFSSELRQWRRELEDGHDAPSAAEPTFLSTREIQRFLVSLGYDLGPGGPAGDGVDGREGKKTRDALMTFQRLNGLAADGLAGKNTRQKMLALFRAGQGR